MLQLLTGVAGVPSAPTPKPSYADIAPTISRITHMRTRGKGSLFEARIIYVDRRGATKDLNFKSHTEFNEFCEVARKVLRVYDDKTRAPGIDPYRI